MSKPVVICVDDEPTVLESLKIDLKRVLGDSCLIETAEGAEEALELFEELQSENYEVALVLADYIMPGLKGDILLQRIHDRSPQTLNIMISGQADLEAVSNALRNARLYRYIAKPWTPEDVNLTIAEAVQNYLKDRKLEAQTNKLKELNITLEVQIQERTEQLQQKMEELEKLSCLKDEFLHAVTHDLRTPATGTLLVFRRLQKLVSDPIPLTRSMIDRMIESSERQLKLLDCLLQIQLSDAQGTLLHYEPTDLAAFVSAIAADLEPFTTEQQAKLINAVPPDLPLVTIDPFQLRRVFENLINNSLKHNPPGICIMICASVEDGVVRCSVEDNGTGIPDLEKVSMFERYTQGKRARRSLGVGLGLYLSRQIIQAHGGEIGVVSAAGQGAKFWFTLPLK
ncbi:hybrid sensor histidine kinase/response regulator [Myxacorys almedinensis]|uniref:histidine kinase n=1 Tax=Myxacorys almedinensis A TaxID=2690445 RepID=A0A8J8CL22_9CYAN|nr:HAMP domain-containing sensor histidine kinase [Myxacorys almedinensis]NDJ19176.1 response regulator [Myxacorys almedinensis A]